MLPRSFSWFATITIVLLLVSSTRHAEAEPTWSFWLNSPPGAWVGNGQPHLFKDQTSPVVFSAFGPNIVGPNAITLVHQPSLNVPFFFLRITNLEALVVGRYDGALRFSGPTNPGLDVAFESHGNNGLTGKFEIFELDYHFWRPNAGQEFLIDKFSFTFSFRGEGTGPEVIGAFAFNTALPLSITEPSSLALIVGGLIGAIFWRRRYVLSLLVKAYSARRD